MKKPMADSGALDDRYQSVFGDVSGTIDAARRAVRIMDSSGNSTTYWNFGDKREDPIHRIHSYPAKFPAFITTKALQYAELHRRKEDG